MSEFNTRIAAQRAIVTTINDGRWAEALFGLSSVAIDRWVSANNLHFDSPLVELIRDAGDKLFFLANKSQEQVTEEYQVLASEIAKIIDKIKKGIAKFPPM